MSSGFISEKEIAEARLKRQEEWEKIRTADQPVDVPEEKYDPRSLFERLEEQRKKRDLEFEESRKLKNMIKGLDDDEIDFLDLVDQKKMEAERNKTMDEERELLDYRNRVANLQEQSMEQRLQAELKNIVKKSPPNQINAQRNNSRLSQNQLLKGGLVIKKNDTRKRKLSENEHENGVENKKALKVENNSVDVNNGSKSDIVFDSNGNSKKETEGMETVKNNLTKKVEIIENSEKKTTNDVLKCIGILPGLGYYGDSSSDSDAESSDIEDVVFSKIKYDITGRKIEEKSKNDDS